MSFLLLIQYDVYFKSFESYCIIPTKLQIWKQRKKEFDSYMKQIFRVCENVYKLFYHSIFLEMYKSCQIESTGLYMKEEFCVENPSTKLSYNWLKENLDYQWRLCDLLIQEIKKVMNKQKIKIIIMKNLFLKYH